MLSFPSARSAWLMQFVTGTAVRAAGVVWLTAALVLFVRRATGHITSPLSIGALVLVTAVLVCGSCGFRAARLPLRDGRRHELQNFWFLLPTVAHLLVLTALTLEGTSLFGLVLMWGIVVAVESAWIARAFQRRQSARLLPRAAESEPRPTGPVPAELGATAPAPQEREWDEERLPEGATQQWLRSRVGDGETLCGFVRVDFAEHERTVSVHLPFYPAFSAAPRVDVAEAGGAEVSVQVAQVEPFGARLEVKRMTGATAADSTVLQIEVTTAGD